MSQAPQYIVIINNVRFGKPCIVNTRIAVADILMWLASGMSMRDILIDYPSLKEEHIKAALTFAAKRENLTKLIAA